MECVFQVRPVEGGIAYEQAGARLCLGPLRLPMPRVLAPRIEAVAIAVPEGMQVRVTIGSALAGWLLTYEGLVRPGGGAMSTALWLLAIQGALGAFDTLYYHEWRARLPGGVPGTRPELMLHAVRDFFYALLFGSLPWVAWRGAWAAVLAVIIVTEIGITLADFVVEDRVRKPLGACSLASAARTR